MPLHPLVVGLADSYLQNLPDLLNCLKCSLNSTFIFLQGFSALVNCNVIETPTNCLLLLLWQVLVFHLCFGLRERYGQWWSLPWVQIEAGSKRCCFVDWIELNWIFYKTTIIITDIWNVGIVLWILDGSIMKGEIESKVLYNEGVHVSGIYGQALRVGP